MIIQYRFLISFIVFFFFAPALLAEDGEKIEISTAKNTVILKNSGGQPSWMQTWKLARKASKDSELLLAVQLYQQLLTEKPNIEEALREYSLLLINIKKWEVASTILQKLLEINPDCQEYLLNTGLVALHLKRYTRATAYLGQVYTADPSGKNAVIALRGQIQALQKQNHKDLAYPLMEQLYLLIPHEESSIRELAQYSIELGHSEKGESYYSTLLNEFNATDKDYLASERLFVKSGDREMALICWVGYLASHPYYISFHKKISKHYLESDQKELALEHLLVLIAHGDNRPNSYLQIGQIYLYKLGRPDKALYYYDEYRKRIPKTVNVEKEIQRIQAILANDLLVIVEIEGAWNLWRDLAKVIPDRLAVYYSMAEQLQKLDKPKELREVLDIIHFHNPEDQEISLQLAQLTFTEKDYRASLKALEGLDEENKKSSHYYLLRARISEIYGHFENALQQYKALAGTGEYSLDIIIHSMQLAGTVGDIEQLVFFHKLSQRPENLEDSKNKSNLLYGHILLENALFTTARSFYSNLVKSLAEDDPYQTVIQGYFARMLSEEGKYFEAEQELRFLLLKEPENLKTIGKLVENSLLAKDWDNAWRWYDVLEEKYQQSNSGNDAINFALLMEKVTILAESGQNDNAIEVAEDFLKQNPESMEIQFALAELYFKSHEYLTAQEVLTLLPGNSLSKGLLLALIDQKSGEVFDPQKKKDSTSSIVRAKLFQRYGVYQQALESINEYLRVFESSIKGRLVKIEILQSMGENFTALQIVEELSKQYPAEEYFQTQTIKINFNSAKFSDIIQFLHSDKPLDKKETLRLTKQNVLFLARAYWAQKKQKMALAIYEEFLQPPVDLLFAKKLKEKQINLQLPKVNRSFLNRVTFTNPAEPNRLSVIMSPQYTNKNIQTPEVEIATGLYAEYRWQKLIQKELSVRKEMDSGNYYQAMKDYQKMLKHNPSMESLFDLAGIYSRLGFLGKEAALYHIIQKESPGYPYLDEAMQRNRLKRKPRISTVYELDKKEGRDGYYDNKQQATGLNTWYMAGLSHTFSMDYRRIYNTSLDNKQDLWRNRFHGEMKWNPSYDIGFLALFGIDGVEGEGRSNLLYDVSVKGKLGDVAEGFLSVSQDVVDDTLEALKGGICAVEYQAGMQFDMLPRLFAGGTYSYTDYSDANYKNRYQVWSAYILNHEPLLLQLRYDYELLHSDKSNEKREFALTGVYGPEDHPYWTQKEYWQHQICILFDHQLTDDGLGRGAPSFYSLGYTFAYEEGGYGNHQLKAQIFLEISRHFLLNSSFEYIDGSECEKIDSNISLIYRW